MHKRFIVFVGEGVSRKLERTKNMSRRNQNRQRSNLRSEAQIRPELGARHPLVVDDDFEFFLTDMEHVLGEVIPDIDTCDSRGRSKTKRRFRVYDDPDKLGVSVLERRLPAKHANKHRLRWTQQDVARVKNDIGSELGRLELTDRIPLRVSLSNVIRLGDADENDARKIGLMVDQETTEAEFLVREHEITVNGIATSLDRFRYPYSTYVPHLSVGRIFRDVPTPQVNEAIAAMNALLPMTVELKPLIFISSQQI